MVTLSEDEMRRIHALRSQGYTLNHIADHMGLSLSNVRTCLKNKIEDVYPGTIERELDREINALLAGHVSSLMLLFMAVDRNVESFTAVVNTIPLQFGLPEEVSFTEAGVEAFLNIARLEPNTSEVVLPKAGLKHTPVPGQLHVSLYQKGYLFKENVCTASVFVFIGRYLWSNKLYVKLAYEVVDAEWIRFLAECFYKFGVPDELIFDTNDVECEYETYGDWSLLRKEHLWFCDALGVKKPKLTESSKQQRNEMGYIANRIENQALPWINRNYGVKNEFEDLNEHMIDWLESCESVPNKYVAYLDDVRYKGSCQDLYEIEREHLQFIDLGDNAFVVSVNDVNRLRGRWFERKGYPITLPDELKDTRDLVFSALSTGHYQVLMKDGDWTMEGHMDPSLLSAHWNKSDNPFSILLRRD